VSVLAYADGHELTHNDSFTPLLPIKLSEEKAGSRILLYFFQVLCFCLII